MHEALITEMEFLNGIFSLGFCMGMGMDSSLLRREFLSGFLSSFFLSTKKCYSGIYCTQVFLFCGLFCLYVKNQSRVGVLKSPPLEKTVNSMEQTTRVKMMSKNSISVLFTLLNVHSV